MYFYCEYKLYSNVDLEKMQVLFYGNVIYLIILIIIIIKLFVWSILRQRG